MSSLTSRVLIVDDYPDTALLVRLQMQRLGYEAVMATGYIHALVEDELAHTQKRPFDLYILDHQLTDGCGNDLRQQLRLHNPVAPTLFYTGTLYTYEEQQDLRDQGDEYLLKPVDTQQFQATVARLLSKSPEELVTMETLSSCLHDVISEESA